jgi:hypothetical protein
MKFQGLWLLPLLTIVTLLFAFSLTFPTQLFARSGCCSHHQGVCGCGCCDGSPLSSTCAPYYPECSRPAYVAPIVTAAPVVITLRPTIKPIVTLAPTPRPTIKATSTPVSTLTPTSSSEVQGASTQNTPTPIPSPTSTPAPLTTGGTIGALAFLAVIIGLPIWIVFKIIGKFRKPKIEI